MHFKYKFRIWLLRLTGYQNSCNFSIKFYVILENDIKLIDLQVSVETWRLLSR